MRPGLIITVFAVFSVGVWVFALIGLASVATTIASPVVIDPPREDSLLSSTSESEPVAYAEVPGLDQLDGFVLTAYRQVSRDEQLVTEVEYVGPHPIAEVGEFYGALFEEHGWTFTEESTLPGRLTYSIAAANRHGTVEVETAEGATEVKIELVQPAGTRGVTTDR